MKYCANCNKTFEDDVKFCPDCGSKLLSKDVCPKCGASISENEKFCPQCGHKLERQRICPKCGEPLDDKAVFCPKCGEKFEDKGYVVDDKKNSPFNDEPAQRAPKKEKKEKSGGNFFTAIKVLNIVYASLTFLVAILVLVGAFGGVFKSSTTNATTETQNIGYFFGDGFKEISKLASGEPKSLATFNMVFETIFYFAGIVGCVTLLVFSVIKNIKAIVYNRRADKKFFSMAMLCLVPYLSLIAGSHFTNSVTKNSGNVTETTVSFGWGTGILFAALITAFAVLMVYSILSAIFEKGPIVATAIHTPLTLMMIIMTVVMFGSFAGLTIKAGSTYEMNLGTNMFTAAQQAAESKSLIDFAGLGTASYALGLIAMVALFAAVIFNVILNMPIFSMSFLGGSMILSIVGGALGGSFGKKYAEKMYGTAIEATGKLGGGVILMIIFTVLIIGGFITEMVLKKKQVIKA